MPPRQAIDAGFDAFTARKLSGDEAAIEVDTHPVFKGGMAVRFDPLFMLETRQGRLNHEETPQ